MRLIVIIRVIGEIGWVNAFPLSFSFYISIVFLCYTIVISSKSVTRWMWLPLGYPLPTGRGCRKQLLALERKFLTTSIAAKQL